MWFNSCYLHYFWSDLAVERFAFRLINPQKIVTLLARDAYEKNSWLQKIRTGIDSSTMVREQLLLGMPIFLDNITIALVFKLTTLRFCNI